jgi:hypothetical protein
MGFFNDMQGIGVLELREGEGSTGPVLQSLVVPVVGHDGGGVSWNSWAVDVPVTAGATITWTFTPDASTLPDPYGVAIGSTNPYPGGVMALVDPSGTWITPFDVVFRTHVDSALVPVLEVFRSTIAPGLVGVANVIATAPASPYDDAAAPSVPLLFYAVDDGAGAPAIIRLARLGPSSVRIAW